MPKEVNILPSERSTPDGPRDTPLDSSTTSPTHGGTPQMTHEERRDLLAEVISEIECRGAELQWHLQGEPLLSSWLVKLREVQDSLAAHGGTAPRPEPDRVRELLDALRNLPVVAEHCPSDRHEMYLCRSLKAVSQTAVQLAVGELERALEAGTAAASLSQKVNNEKDQEGFTRNEQTS